VDSSTSLITESILSIHTQQKAVTYSRDIDLRTGAQIPDVLTGDTGKDVLSLLCARSTSASASPETFRETGT